MKMLKWRDGVLEAHEASKTMEISFADWQEGVLPAGRTVLVLPNDIDVQSADGDFSDFDAIILDFPHFKDGRAYSQARRLREQFAFEGEIRARGDVGRDQALFMIRSGIDAFDVSKETTDGFVDALGEYSVFYQSAADATSPVWRLRMGRAMAA